MTSLRLGAPGAGDAAMTGARPKRKIAKAIKARSNMAAPARTFRGGSLLCSSRSASAPFHTFAQCNRGQMRRRQVIGGFMETEPVRLLAPERLDNEDAAEHHQADDVDCFFQGG